MRKLAVRSDLGIPILIGKAGFGAVIDLDSNFVSRSHANIEVMDNTLLLEDLNSTNGTFVNGKEVKKVRLNNGDVITFGGDASYKITVEMLPKSGNGQLGKVDDAFDKSGGGQGLENAHSEQFDQHGTGELATYFQHKNSILIGRSKDCDIVLPQLVITRKHAVLNKHADGSFVLEDLGSRNGTFVNGKRIEKPTVITENDDINIGAYRFCLKRPAEDIRKHIAVVAEGLTKAVNKGKAIILHDVSFKLAAKDFVAIMGPSGCGKSTLLRALNGDSPATEGKVFIHDIDLYENYDYLKRLIGYVPQDDIVHKELTVEGSLYYAAKLRLSGDVSKQDIAQKIDEVLTNLNINEPEIRKRKIGNLSGGQRKRVSIAVELLTDPSVLFLDEPTSPLDPETIEDFLVCLRELARKGTSILMVTHKPDDLYYVDKVLFLSKGGYMTYYGSKKKYLQFFEAENVIEVYSKNGTPEQGREWVRKLRNHHPPSAVIPKPNKEIEKHSNESFFKQLFWLTARYFNIKTSDRANLLSLLAQPVIIAGLLAAIFEELELSVLFFMAISAIWFGTNNAAREIVSELSVYKRERMFNLRILPYALSKIFVLTFFSALQVFLFTGIVYLFIGTDMLYMVNYWSYFGIMLYLAFSATLLGLLISALLNSNEKVLTVLPIVLIPQIILAGVITKIPEKSVVELASYTMLSRWGTEGFAYAQDSIRSYFADPLCPGELTYKTVNAIEFLDMPNTIGLPAQLSSDLWAISVLNLFAFIGILWALKRKDSL